MSAERERDVSEAFVALVDSLVDGFDVVDRLSGLTTDCARLLDIASAGVLLTDRWGVLHVVAASSEATRNLELFQLQRDEGPCLESYHSGKAVIAADHEAHTGRWPQFVGAALDAGFRALHAVPMRLYDNRLGTVGLFGRRVGMLGVRDLNLAQALAHVGSVALVQGTSVRGSGPWPSGSSTPSTAGSSWSRPRAWSRSAGAGHGRGLRSAAPLLPGHGPAPGRRRRREGVPRPPGAARARSRPGKARAAVTR